MLSPNSEFLSLNGARNVHFLTAQSQRRRDALRILTEMRGRTRIRSLEFGVRPCISLPSFPGQKITEARRLPLVELEHICRIQQVFQAGDIFLNTMRNVGIVKYHFARAPKYACRLSIAATRRGAAWPSSEASHTPAWSLPDEANTTRCPSREMLKLRI